MKNSKKQWVNKKLFTKEEFEEQSFTILEDALDAFWERADEAIDLYLEEFKLDNTAHNRVKEFFVNEIGRQLKDYH